MRAFDELSEILEENELGETFCILPWLQIGVQPTGILRPCPWTIDYPRDAAGSCFYASQHSLEDYKKSDSISALKQRMLKGEKSQICERCYEYEGTGSPSKRIHETLNFKHLINKEFLADENSHKILELRLGNRCNIGCVTCSPGSSSFLGNEFSKQESKNQSDYHRDFQKSFLHSQKIKSQWFTDKNFWEQVEEILPNIKTIYLAGGEPTMIPEVWNFLDEMVGKGKTQSINIELSTNMTLLGRKHLEILKNFKSVRFFVSFDGIGDTIEYIRYPTRWKIVEKNFKNLLQFNEPSFEVIITPTVSIFTLWHLDDLYQWAFDVQKDFEKKIRISCNTVLRDPDYQCIENLPNELKLTAWDQIERIKNKYPEEIGTHSLSKVQKYLKEREGNVDLFVEGQKHVENFDKIRKKNWQNIVPIYRKYWT
ncbi:MAG: twitch domain-containing radical SAM protein [Pseudomonadota bacterium]